MAQLSPEQRAILRRLVYLRSLSDVAVRKWEKGERKELVKCSDVAKWIAKEMDKIDSPWFRRDVDKALRAIGWRSVTHHHIRLWRAREKKT